MAPQSRRAHVKRLLGILLVALTASVAIVVLQEPAARTLAGEAAGGEAASESAVARGSRAGLDVLPTPSASSPLASPLPSRESSDGASPSDVASSTASPGPVASGAERPPDEVDRRWPRNPPWDACPQPVWPGQLASGAPGGGRRVLVLGDSLTRESRVDTARLLRASGWTPTFRCWGSKRLDWGLQQVARARALGHLPAVVVVALGTNDISWESPSTTERRVRTLLDRLGPRRQVLWVDLDVDHSAFSRSRADWFNRMIRSVEAKRPQLTVIDWEKKARGTRAWRSDGIHYGAAGYRLRAQVVAEAVNRLGSRGVPSTPTVPESTASPIPTPPPPGVGSFVDPAP